MPCNTDYMEPTSGEIRVSKLACVYDFITTGRKISKTEWRGYHPAVYNQTYDRYSDGKFDKVRVYREVIEHLSTVDKSVLITYPLEVQIWWRDEQELIEREKKRVEYENKQERLKKLAISKLTTEELKALGIE